MVNSFSELPLANERLVLICKSNYGRAIRYEQQFSFQRLFYYVKIIFYPRLRLPRRRFLSLGNRIRRRWTAASDRKWLTMAYPVCVSKITCLQSLHFPVRAALNADTQGYGERWDLSVCYGSVCIHRNKQRPASAVRPTKPPPPWSVIIASHRNVFSWSSVYVMRVYVDARSSGRCQYDSQRERGRCVSR